MREGRNKLINWVFLKEPCVVWLEGADDLTIEAFGRAFKRLHQYTPNFAFSTWLFKIASNNAIDHLRKKKQGEALSLDTKYVNEEGQQLSQNIKAGTLDPEENFMKKQKIQIILY